MDLMALRRMLLNQPHTKTIGGLIVLIDNYKYEAGYQPYNENITRADGYFITGWYDSGSNASKSYTIGPSNTSDYWYGRWYNDQSGNAVDYWGTNKSTTRTVSAPGRYITFTVEKLQAANFYVYDNTNGRYVIKGANVT